MSVAAFVINECDANNTNFYVPIATEEFFEKYWKPAAEELGLIWIPLFQFGLDITAEDMESVNTELDALQEWTGKYMSGDPKEHLLTRANLLQTKLNTIFAAQKDIRICIG
ncbi:hypothetical protein CDO73_01895 [Saccharibacillus sp. O23]|uniref:hypothetical protein n=1 Tax=Saccharibacillus sp. O23 TaxID=2009338 RepID=UPI000B4DF67D|nr:hypothetical protein [Saccharibacillus sp. O23]OWR32383.1 hypothetical protein CDO73_01895 [Saccharibacillus sp. O23]